MARDKHLGQRQRSASGQRCWLLGLLLIVPALLWAQPQPVPTQPVSNALTASRPPLIRRMSLEEGLPSSEVNALAEDQSGYLWIGTAAGLVRYDGRRFHPWQAEGAPAGGVERILIDSQDRLWYSVTEGGLVQLDQARRLVHVFSSELDSNWPGDDLFALLERPDGRLWAGSFDAGLILIDPLTQHYQTLPLHATQTQPTIADLALDASGNLWIATYEHGLFQLQAQASTPLPVSLPGLSGDHLRALAIDGARIWIAARDHGVCLWQPGHAPDCSEFDLAAPALGRTFSLELAADGTLWVGRAQGLSWRESNGSWRHLAPLPGVRASLPARILWDLHTDREGGLWIASIGGGLSYLSPTARQVEAWLPAPTDPTSLPEARITGVSVDGAALWLGTMDNGLQHLDPNGSGFRRRLSDRLSTNRVWDVAVAIPANGTMLEATLWLAHEHGLSLLGADSTLDRHWSTAQLHPRGSGVADLLWPLDQQRSLISVLGSGISLVDRSGAVQVLSADQNLPDQVEDIQSGHGEIWVASEQGVHRFDPGCDCLRWLGLPAQRTFALAADASGWWLAVNGAVQHLSLVQSRWSVDRVQTWEGRPAGGLAADRSGRLWLSGPDGLWVLEPDADAWRSLVPSLGAIAAELSSRPIATSDSGRLLFSSERGLLSIDPERLPPTPMLNQLRLTQVGLRRGGDWIELDLATSARLQADDRDLSVTVESPLISEGDALRYQFKLSGFDADWVDSSDGHRVLGSLPDGSYRLLARVWHPGARDRHLQMAWDFAVAPPWWRSQRKIVSYLLALLLLGYAAHRLQKARLETRHQRAMNQQQVQWAERNVEDKSAFLARLSHEIRNPLGGMIGLVNMAERFTQVPEQRSRLAMIRAAGAQIQALLEDVLVWSQVQRNDLVLQPRPVAVAKLIAEVVQRHQPYAEQMHIRLSHQGDEGLWVQADRQRLAQILDNLLGNALKFSEGGQVLLSWRAVDAELIQIAVSDQGPGISAEAEERIFQPRAQVHADGRGLGLGLSIARQLAERMGGTLSLDRRGWSAVKEDERLAADGAVIGYGGAALATRGQPDWSARGEPDPDPDTADASRSNPAFVRGPGARFVLRLPHAPSAVSGVDLAQIGTQDSGDAQTRRADQATAGGVEAQPDSTLVPAMANSQQATRGGRLLLVEDDPIQRARWVEELAANGWQVSAHGEALAALSDLCSGGATALITDLGLPVVDGLALIGLVRAQPKLARLPILVITARALPADRAAAIEAGADEVLVKPLEVDRVLQWLGSVKLE